MLALCSYQASSGGDIEIDKEKLKEDYLELSKQGYKVIALASRKL